jgi:DNA-binding LacI/PurR family transcriptional regulator
VEITPGENISQLRFSDYQGGMLAAEFLHSRGCTEYLSFTLGDDYCFQHRMSGFSDYCQKHNLPCQVFPFETPGQEWNKRYVAVMERMEPFLRPGKTPGVFLPSDSVLLSCAGRLVERGFAVGRDIHLVGYNDSDFSGFQPWPFATLKQDFLKEGRLAVEMLAGLLAGEAGRKMELMPELKLWNYPESEKHKK